jgi:hypothetical protein
MKNNLLLVATAIIYQPDPGRIASQVLYGDMK